MGENHKSQLLKGVLQIVILRLLAEQESYGYELVERVRKMGLADLADGSIYPALGRMEREGYLKSRLVASYSGPARKYYVPSASGYTHMAETQESWLALVKALEPMITKPIPVKPKEAVT